MAASDYRRNRQIRVPEVRLIDAEGEQVGIVPTDEARKRADASGLDLVEVSPHARPPVCRIMDFGKFKYEQKKKEKGSHKPSSQLKELRVRPAIDKHDLSYRLEAGRRFLEQGHKVQVVCIFRGRQMAHPEHGYEVMRSVAETLGDISRVETKPRMMGRRMTMLLSHAGKSEKAAAKPRAASGGGTPGGGGSSSGGASSSGGSAGGGSGGGGSGGGGAKPSPAPDPSPARSSESAPKPTEREPSPPAQATPPSQPSQAAPRGDAAGGDAAGGGSTPS